MLQSFKDRLFRLWDQRFMFGLDVGVFNLGLVRYSNGSIGGVLHGPRIISTGTQHWPWFIFEGGFSTGSRSNWHIGVLGFTVGRVIVNDYDQSTGEIVGPDKRQYYYFFKCLNHRGKQLEEIIYADNSPSKV